MNSKSCIFVLLLLVGAEVARAQSGGSNDEFLSASSINSGSGSSNSGSGSSSGSSSGYGDQCYCYSLKDYLNSEYYDQAKLVLRVDIVSTRDISPKGYDYQRKVYIAKVSHIWQSDYYKQQYGGSNSEYPSIECGTTVAIIIKPSGDCTKIPPFEVYKSYIITAYSDLHYDYEYPTIYYNPCYDAWSLFCTAWGDSEIVSKLQAWDSTRCQPCQPYSTYYSSSYLSGGNSGSSSSGSDEYASSSSSSTTYACAYCNDTYKQFKSYDDAYCAGYYVATGDYAKCPNYNTVKYSDSDYDQQEYYPQNEQSYNDYYTAAEDDYKEY